MKASAQPSQRLKGVVRGAVQGVGFRPFVFRLAHELKLAGWVSNSGQGVFIEVEGKQEVLAEFRRRLENAKPPRAIIQSAEFSFLEAVGYEGFEIRESNEAGSKTVLILPDIATCPYCLREIFNPANRRYRYPFNNCTNCGPRFSIIEALPYDRPHTSMKAFAMCPECAREYHDPLDRRFDAQPIACPVCGPQLALWDAAGNTLSQRDEALCQAAEAIRTGRILALKGLGGFQLLADARNEDAIRNLRVRKRREEKPFALMFPSLGAIREACEVSELEERLLCSPESPIVLLRRKADGGALAPALAPRNPSLGVMLPYTPLHHLLMVELGFPIVATSGNLSDEPICIQEREAVERLCGIADAFLVHNRPIVRHVDDSIVRIACGRELVLRRARGYAPLPVHVRTPLPTILATGAHLKNSVALSVSSEIFVSQHIGDLTTAQAYGAFHRTVTDLPRLYDAVPEAIACDLHPEYLSTRFAAKQSSPRVPVQHHWAHVLACMAENELKGPVLGVSWDGTGLGLDGTIWGGEFLLCRDRQFSRVAHLRRFRLPGGESAIKQPARTALGLLFEMEGEDTFQRGDLAPLRSLPERDRSLIRQILCKGIHAPLTSSAGRLFDAIASLLGLRQRLTFEGQAAMDLEFSVQSGIDDSYPFKTTPELPSVLDWQPLVEAIFTDLQQQESVGVIAARFHNTLAEMIVTIAQQVGEPKVVLTGGCFQNLYLLERTVARLQACGFAPYWHQRIPPNDGGIALGQIVAAASAISAIQTQTRFVAAFEKSFAS